jgi:heme-degrading monooxygenase HmoA
VTATGWLRVVLYDMRDVAFDHFETPLRYVRANIGYFAGVLEKQPGFVTAHWGVDLDEGKIAAVTRWSSLEAITAAAADLGRLAADAEAHGIHRMHVSNIELFPVAEAEDHSDDEITAESWLRVVSYGVRGLGADGDGTQAQDYMVGHLSDFVRVLETQPGFRRGYWGRDPQAGMLAAVTYWDSRRSIADARPALQRLQADAAAAGVRQADAHNIHLFAVTVPRSQTAVNGYVDALRQRRPVPRGS